MRPFLSVLDERTVEDIEAEAIRILEAIGVFVEYDPARALLLDGGAREGEGGRIRIPPDLVERALGTAPRSVALYDREGAPAARLEGDRVHFDPGSAAIRVYDYGERRLRDPVTEDCVRFARLTDGLENLALQSTCVIPTDVPKERADRHRLYLALVHGKKAVITGTFGLASFDAMYEMLCCVRGSGEALREKPLALFDCCPSPPLKWSELTCACLVACAERGVPAELVSMPLTGATAPVTLLGAVVQHTAENLSGVVIHQLAGPGSPIVYGGSPSAFDLRHGTTPMGAVETMMIDLAYARVGKHLGLPVHAYMGLSDAKLPDWQAGMESGAGAVLAALGGINVVSGPGMLDFESCQSLEHLVLANEACGAALRLVEGLQRRDEVMALEVIRAGLEAGHFLALDHTRRWAREEFRFPGPALDRTEGMTWEKAGRKDALERAHEEVVRILERAPEGGLEPDTVKELERLAGAR